MRRVRPYRGLMLAAFALGGCGGSTTSAGADGGADARAQLDAFYPEAAAEAAPADAALADAGPPDTTPFIPVPADIQFAAVNPVGAGEQLLFNDWAASPNTVRTMQPDGTGATTIFEAYRVWSMGASRAGDRLAFSCGDPQQEAHYGLTIGDSIQHTWLYDMASQAVELLAYGNINDECHTFAPGDDAIYLCRRYDFQPDGANRGWRLGRIDLPAKEFSFLTPDTDLDWALWPQPTPDDTQLYYGRIQISGTTQTRSLMRMPVATLTPVLFQASASSLTLAPDGQHVVFQNWADGFRLYVMAVDGSGLTKVAARQSATTARWSPDGTQIAFLWQDQAVNCSHIEVVKADGTEAAAPRRLRDCSTTTEMVTELEWITR